MTQLVLVPSRGTVRVPHCVPAFLAGISDSTMLRKGQLIQWTQQPQLEISSKGLNNLSKFLNVQELEWPEGMASREISTESIRQLQKTLRDKVMQLDSLSQLTEKNRMVIFRVLGITSHCIAFDANLLITENPHG